MSVASPLDQEPDLSDVIRRVRARKLTYLGERALADLAAAVTSVERSDLPGLIVETGTALGGSAIVIAVAKSPERPLHLHDVFGMIPPPTAEDGPDVHDRYRTIVAGESRGLGGDTYYGYRTDLVDEVAASLADFGLAPDEHAISLVQGLFQDTLSGTDPVALAHLDGDWYESTKVCLERIAPRLVVGGRLVIDDYGHWSGCRAAVDEYLASPAGGRLRREERSRLHLVRV